MKYVMQKGFLVLMILSAGGVYARSLFTPLSIQWDAKHYLFANKAFYVKPSEERREQSYVFDLWGYGYARSADCAYSCSGNCQVPLATVLFGKSSFTIREAFYNSELATGANPLLGAALITPNIEFDEKGAIFGVEWRSQHTWRDKNARWGVRVRLPIKVLSMNRRYTGTDAKAEFETLDSVRRLVTEDVKAGATTRTINDSFAYRLDFLSKLVVNNTTNEAMVHYTGAGPNHHLMMANKDMTSANGSPVQVIARTDGTVPHLPFASATIPTKTLSANGSGLNNNQRAKFGSSVDYTPLSTDAVAQSELWVVATSADTQSNMTDEATALLTEVEAAIKRIHGSVTDYFADVGLNFNAQRVQGLGDLTTQLFANCDWRDGKYMTELTFGILTPTGKQIHNALRVLAQPLGNNGHFELYPGVEAWWNVCPWLSISADFAYHWVLRRKETVATAFEGTCVKNVGRNTCASVSWNYLIFHPHITLFEPTKQCAGFDLGYELYRKGCDHIHFLNATGYDLDGHLHPLCNSCLSRLTHVLSQKVQADFFVSKSLWAIFGGGDYVFAGKNAPKEASCHLGFLVEF